MLDEKVSKYLENCTRHTEKYVLDHKKDFSSTKVIYNKLLKKNNVDHAFEYTKEIVKRMERDKLNPQAAMKIAETLMPAMESMRSQVIKMAVPLILGVILMLVFTGLLVFQKPFDFSNSKVIYYSIGLFLGAVSLSIGLIQRNKFKSTSLTTTMIFQASSAYSAAKMQGQGSFGALRILEEMKANPGKQMQVRVNQPKIVYKR